MATFPFSKELACSDGSRRLKPFTDEKGIVSETFSGIHSLGQLFCTCIALFHLSALSALPEKSWTGV